MHSNTPAQNAGSNLMNSWKLAMLDQVPQNRYSVFSTFSCGGGSSMGYKLAGFKVIGNCEIDPKIARMYQKNLHPRYSYVMDIRDFNNLPDEKIPSELFSLDILDGSPPCSVFSMAGEREKAWGKKKKFREGQQAQTLDDLFFEYIRLADRLRPRVVVAENVRGLVQGNAKGYVREILRSFDKAGYAVQIFCLNAALMGVPQRRERVFFIGQRKDLHYPKIKMHFGESPILFGQIRTEQGKPATPYQKHLLERKQRSDHCLGDVSMRLFGKSSQFNNSILWDDEVASTLTSNGTIFRAYDDKQLSDLDIIRIQTFPEDYDFNGQPVQYVCGMSVPPVMMMRIADEIRHQWLDCNQ